MAAPMKLKMRPCCHNLLGPTWKALRKHIRHLNSQEINETPKETNLDNEGFRRYQLKKIGSMDKKREKRERKEVKPVVPRYTKMPVNQDWTSVWPAAQSFRWSVVPLPVRQGALKRKSESKGDGFPPEKYANTELIKIPNFLHLTPKHIQKHCEAIKKFCTEWPEELKTEEDMDYHFPVTIVTEDYCFASPSVRDSRARVVTMKLKMNDLELDNHAKEKLQRLIGSRKNEIVLTADRCPLKQQNYDYLQYLLTALYFESWKVEPWESEMTVEDMLDYSWDHNPSKENIVKLLNIYKEKDKTIESEKRQLQYLSEEVSESTVTSLEPVSEYKSAVEELFHTGENITTVNNYKSSVMKLLNIQAKSDSANS